MFITKASIPRRAFLQGIGATLALPLLDAMTPASTALAQTVAGQRVRRFGAAYVPQGMVQEFFFPDTTEAGFALPTILKPFEPVRDHLTVLSGLSNGPIRAGGHSLASPMFLTGNLTPKRTEGYDLENHITIDQALAKEWGKETLFPSLELAAEDFSTSAGSCEGGFSCIYQNTISWKTATTPLPTEINPRLVFERMFGGASGTGAERATQARERRSVLDAVGAQAKSLQAKLGPADRGRLDSYLQNVREIEQRLDKADAQKALSELPVAPAGVPDDYTERVNVMYDLAVLAFQADIARVFTLMMARELSSQTFPMLGFVDAHHAASHHQNRPEKIAHYVAMNTYHASLVSRFIQKLKATPDGEYSLLDNTLFLWGTGMGNGDTHTYAPLPTVLLGGDSGRQKGDRNLVLPKDTPHANLMLTLAQRNGLEMEKFGNSTGTLSSL